ncbi:hypothetical protein ACLJKV_003857, partial [Cronobacter sakazakii]
GWGLFFFYAFSFIPVMAFRVSEFLCVVIIILFANMMYLFRQSYIYFAFVTSVGIIYFITQGIMANLSLSLY